MKEFLFQDWPEIIAVVVSIGALFVSIKAWYKSRAIYDIETEVIRQPTGKRNDMDSSMKHISRKLSTGIYTILAILERSKSDKDWEVFLGRLNSERKSGVKGKLNSLLKLVKGKHGN